MTFRTLTEIADDIIRTWGHDRIYYAARPYVDAMAALDSIDDPYLHDTGEDIVRRFLLNATYWRGPDARRIKFELRSMLPENRM